MSTQNPAVASPVLSTTDQDQNRAIENLAKHIKQVYSNEARLARLVLMAISELRDGHTKNVAAIQGRGALDPTTAQAIQGLDATGKEANDHIDRLQAAFGAPPNGAPAATGQQTS